MMIVQFLSVRDIWTSLAVGGTHTHKHINFSKGAVFFNPSGGAGVSFRNSNFFSQPPLKFKKFS